MEALMEQVDESEFKWLDRSGEELVRELLDDNTPIYFLPKAAEPKEDRRTESIIHKLISTVYSGPTISDIESALSVSFRNREQDGQSSSTPIVSLPDKSLGRIENKYTLRIKICGNGLADDGYKWRKYGQKSIKNSPNPRSYYRCTNPRCNAKKQVEKSIEDPETLIVTYEGLHLHYTYSHFLPSRLQDDSNIANPHTPKKPKLLEPGPHQSHAPPDQNTESTPSSPATVEGPQAVMTRENQAPGLTEDTMEMEAPVQVNGENPENWFLQEEQRQRGLLEDIVPLLVRKPCTSTTSSSDPSYCYQISSPSYTSSLSWPYDTPYLDVGILSSII